MKKYKLKTDSKHENAIKRMVAILRVIKDEHRPDIIRQVIEIGEDALENNSGQ